MIDRDKNVLQALEISLVQVLGSQTKRIDRSELNCNSFSSLNVNREKLKLKNDRSCRFFHFAFYLRKIRINAFFFV